MALNFTTPIELPTGIELQSAYGRVYCVDPQQGTEIQGFLEVFTSKQDWIDGKTSNTNVPFKTGATKPYDRAVDGVDILDFAHDALIEALAGQGFIAVKDL